jgi:hypothetical protein
MNPNLTADEISGMSNAELLAITLEIASDPENAEAIRADGPRIVRLISFARSAAAAELQRELKGK